jgi:nitrite reductase/ring-hydroxylating ferredoxin subunit
MLLAIVGQERVVVGKCTQGLFAFNDACTHQGGSLCDGTLIGGTVQCPWHGSQFDIQTGRVVAGPAEQKIEVYPVEVRSGEVYVKLRPVRVEAKPNKVA